jgi:hypothetical protein
MQIKSVLADLARRRILGLGLPNRPQVVGAADAIVVEGRDIAARQPPDIDEIADRIRGAYVRGDVPERSDFSKAPWCLWSGARPLARDREVLSRYLAHFEKAHRKSTFSRLAAIYLAVFPHNDQSLASVALTLNSIAPFYPGVWLSANRDFNLFEPVVAPGRLANAALLQDASPAAILASYGLTSLSAEGGLVEAAFLAGLTQVRSDSSLSYIERFTKLKAWATRADGTLMFDQHRGSLVDALILPCSEVMPPKEIRDLYLGFLIANFDDPRLLPGRWVQMPHSTPIVRRWLTEQSLRQFLDVVDRAALEYQWQYRRVFWEAVYRRNLIAEAWVIFDDLGAEIAKRIFETETPFGRWSRGGSKQIERGHACLLLKIGTGIVAEWSHNGRCNVWHDATDPTAPQMHKKLYQSTEVMVSSNRQTGHRRAHFVHHSSDRYTWQDRVADEIAKMTGVRVLQSEYRVR